MRISRYFSNHRLKLCNLQTSASNIINSLYLNDSFCELLLWTVTSIVYIVAVKLRRRPTSKSANSARLRESFARLEFRHDGIEGTRIPGVRANVKTHLVHLHERASGHVLARTYALALAHTRPGFLWSDQWLEWLALDVEPKILSVFPRSSSSLRPFTSLFHRRSARRSSSRSSSLGLPSPREVQA